MYKLEERFKLECYVGTVVFNIVSSACVCKPRTLRTRLLAVSSSDISPAQPVSLLLLSPDPVLLLFWPFSLLPSCLRWLVVEILLIIFYFQHKPV